MNIDLSAVHEVARMYQADSDDVLAVVTGALTTAYAKSPGAVEGAVVEVDEEGTCRVWGPDDVEVEAAGFGRLAATVLRQAVMSWAKDAQRRSVVGVWADREGTAHLGRVVGYGKGGELRLDVAGTQAVMPAGESIADEQLAPGDEKYVLVLAANATETGRTKLTVSRRQPALVSAVLAAHCPKVADGTVQVLSVAREPGVRSKAVISGTVDPVAAVLHPNGAGMRAVAAAIAPEAIDLVPHSDDIVEFAKAALSPIAPARIVVLDDTRGTLQAQLPASAAATAATLGRGACLRLATKVTGRKIVIAVADDD